MFFDAGHHVPVHLPATAACVILLLNVLMAGVLTCAKCRCYRTILDGNAIPVRATGLAISVNSLLAHAPDI